MKGGSMLIIYRKGNLLESEAEALVNTVNCVGVMGKGIALQFKYAYPENFKQYQKACRDGQVQLGKMFIVETKSLVNPKYIINFPTKYHWKNRSKLEDIQEGLKDLVQHIQALNIQSVALPPLGCGNGGLNWTKVKPLIEQAMQSIPDVTVYVYEPMSNISPVCAKVRTNKPKMTKSRAMFILLMHEYSIPGYLLSLLEIQKLAYFLQEVDEPLRLRFQKHLYGPCAENLNHVLQHMEGHYIRGYGDRSSRAQITLLSGAVDEAKAYLQEERDAQQRLNQVFDTIYGFETPYGLELLATVHWVMKEKPQVADDVDQVIREVQCWNERKKRIFKPQHIRIAWEHLKQQMK
jgi:O-acetyl-ADP-ribose deacetylase (regulator of RNase III)